jgi:hypothetical protein
MKFTKTAVVVAIAGIAAAPMMAAAETTLSGVVQINLQGTDADDDAADLTFAGGDVNINLNAQQALNSGLTGYGNYRLDGDSLSGGGLTSDSVHVGVKGGFGDFRLGEVNTIAEYGQVAGDLHDQTGAINGGVHYEGSFGPASIGLVWAPENNEDVIGAGAKFSLGGFAIGVGAEERAGEMNASVGASFGFAGASVAVHYVTKEQGADEDGTVIAAKVGYGIAGINLGLTYSQAEDIADFETKIRFDAGYDLGGGMGISTRVTSSVDNTDATVDDLLEYRVQLSKSF